MSTSEPAGHHRALPDPRRRGAGCGQSGNRAAARLEWWNHIVSDPTPARRKRADAGKPTPYGLPDAASEQALARRMGIFFNNPLLLRLALTHRSVLQDWLLLDAVEAMLQSNERLEFLGDALLGAFVAEYLYVQDPEADEGELTRRRVAIVRAETLVRWSRELELPSCLYLGTGEKVTESARDRMLAGAWEALVGAVYLDGGRDAAERFVMSFLDRDGQAIRMSELDANPKGRLQEILQDRAIPAPDYVTIAAEGPDHARQFTEAVIVEGNQLGAGTGRSKRVAQQEAARQAILALEQGEDQGSGVAQS